MLVLRATHDELLLKKDGVCVLLRLVLVIETAAVDAVLSLYLVHEVVVELVELAEVRQLADWMLH